MHLGCIFKETRFKSVFFFRFAKAASETVHREEEFKFLKIIFGYGKLFSENLLKITYNFPYYHLPFLSLRGIF